MRPIDADELKKDLGEVLMNLMKSHETSRIEKVGFALDVVDEAETLDVAPVVHGHMTFKTYNYKCSECGGFTRHTYAKYCPNCGAKMDKEKQK